MNEKVLKRFSLDSHSGEIVKTWAYNQGFYNLFLAIGLFASAIMLNTSYLSEGKILASAIMLMIIGAGLVLFISDSNFLRAALIQLVPPLIGIILLGLS